MTWTICRRGATHRLRGPVVSFTRCGESLLATTSEEVWEVLGRCERADWYMDAQRGLVALAPRSEGKYVVRHTAGRALRVSLNPMVREAYMELLRGKRFTVTTGEQAGVGLCMFFSVHQHDAGVSEHPRATPAMRAAGRDAIAAYVQANVALSVPVITDRCIEIGGRAGLTEAEVNRAVKATLAEFHDAQLAERRGKG